MSIEIGAKEIVIGIAVLSLAGSAAVMYYAGGNRGAERPSVSVPGVPGGGVMPGPAPSGAPGVKGVPTMVESAQRLAQRLDKQDGSAEDWTLLARSYVELQMLPEAARAFARAAEKAPNDMALRKESEAAGRAAEAPAPAR